LQKYPCPLDLVTLGLFAGMRTMAQEEVFAMIEPHARTSAFGERAAYGQQQRLYVLKHHRSKRGPGEDGSQGFALFAVHAGIVFLIAIFARLFISPA
jgi:hypothetical protein